MRELKFRAWSERGNNWTTIGMWQGEKYSGLSEHEDIVIMQYTGLKDKNGKEIYEGDIVDECEETFGDKRQRGTVVEYNEGAFYPVCMQPSTTFEIVGNVYENPELLNNEPNDKTSVATGDAQSGEAGNQNVIKQ